MILRLPWSFFLMEPNARTKRRGGTTPDFRLGHRTATLRCPPVRLSELLGGVSLEADGQR